MSNSLVTGIEGKYVFSAYSGEVYQKGLGSTYWVIVRVTLFRTCLLATFVVRAERIMTDREHEENVKADQKRMGVGYDKQDNPYKLDHIEDGPSP